MTYLRFEGLSWVFAYPGAPAVRLAVTGGLYGAHGDRDGGPLFRVLLARHRRGDEWPSLPAERLRNALLYVRQSNATEPPRYVASEPLAMDFRLTKANGLSSRLEQLYYAHVVGRTAGDPRFPAPVWAREAPLIRIEPC